MTSSTLAPDGVESSVRRAAASLATAGVSSEHSVWPIAPGSGIGAADEVLGGHRGLEKKYGVRGTEGSGIMSRIYGLPLQMLCVKTQHP